MMPKDHGDEFVLKWTLEVIRPRGSMAAVHASSWRRG